MYSSTFHSVVLFGRGSYLLYANYRFSIHVVRIGLKCIWQKFANEYFLVFSTLFCAVCCFCDLANANNRLQKYSKHFVRKLFKCYCNCHIAMPLSIKIMFLFGREIVTTAFSLLPFIYFIYTSTFSHYISDGKLFSLHFFYLCYLHHF